MAELEDLEEHLTAVRSQNASLIGELESLKRQLSAASLSSIDTTIPSASAVPAYRHLGRPASSPMLRRGGSHRPSRTPEAARRLAGGSRRRAATAGAARTTPLAPSLVDFLDSVGLSSSSRTVHVPKGPASVYSPQRPRTPSMMHRCPPKLGTNHPPPRCPPTSRAQTLDVWRKEQDARREADELRWRRHACEGASGASLAKELKERSRRAGLPEQTVTIAGQSRPATAQIDRRRAPLLRKRPPLTRSVASFDATERRLWSTTVSTGLEQQVAALMAAAGGTRPDTAARVAAEVHAAHAASLAARAAAREAAAAGSSGELLVLDDGDSEREAAAPATEEEARSSTSAQESHRAGCRVLLDVIRGWDTSGKCKLPRAHFEFMLSTLAPDVIVDPELQRTLLDECDTREPGVADLRLFCEMLADESNVGRVTFSAELQPNTRRSLRSAKELPIGSNVLGQPAQPAPWAEPYGDGSNHREIAVTTSDEVNSALRAQLARLGEQLRVRDPDQTGELSESDFIEGISSMNFLLSSSEIESLFRDADKSASGKVIIDRFVARAHEQISSKNVVPAYMVLKHQRSIDMSTSLKWSTDERFTEREGRAELKRWLRCHPSPFSEEALSLR